MMNIPDIISAYCNRAILDPSAECMDTVFEQKGQMRLAPERKWMPFKAQQYACAHRVEFCWQAQFKMAPLLFGSVVDAFQNGSGRLDAKMWGVVPIARGRGADIDHGEIQRYLAELVWCPMAFLHNPQLCYRQFSETLVRVWAFDEDVYVDLKFNHEGDIVGARTTTRVRDNTPQPWAGRFYDFKTFAGIRAPSKGEVWWETPAGPFVYWRGSITSLEWRATH